MKITKNQLRIIIESFINEKMGGKLSNISFGSSFTNTGFGSSSEKGDGDGLELYDEMNIEAVKGNYPKENIDLVVKELNNVGITNPNAIMGVLSVIAKESNFKPKGEKGYSGTSLSRIKEVFGKNTIKVNIDNIKKGTPFKNLTDDQILRLKSSNEKFFNALYGGRIGNNQPGDGWKFRGRGFNQLTGRSNYRKAGFESNPDAVNNPASAAKVVAKFMTIFHPNVWSKEELNSAKTPEEGTKMAADINGGRRNKVRARRNALARLPQFKEMFQKKDLN